MDEDRKTGDNRSVEEQYEEYQHRMQQQLHYQQQVMAYGYHQQQQLHPSHWNAPQQQMYSVQQQQQHLYGGYQYPLQQMEGVPLPLPLPPGIPGLGGSTDPLEAVLGPFPCARLRNLPYDASLEDILLLFQGLVVIDVILVGNGEAYVIFANPIDFQMALQRDRQPIGRQFVEISAATRDQYYSAIARQHMQEQEGGRHVDSSVASSALGRDEASGEEKQESAIGSPAEGLWSGAASPTPTSSVIQPLGSSPTFSEPLVSSQQQISQPPQIVSQPQQQHALPPGIVLSGRGASGSSRPSLHAPTQKRTGGGIQVGEHTGYLRMRGLPFSSTKEDIFHFFEGYNPLQESIVLTYRNDGRATGEAYVGFASPEDSKRAMELHRRMMGSRYIELFISNKDEQGRALARFGNR